MEQIVYFLNNLQKNNITGKLIFCFNLIFFLLIIHKKGLMVQKIKAFVQMNHLYVKNCTTSHFQPKMLE
jgi:hypothetical protein